MPFSNTTQPQISPLLSLKAPAKLNLFLHITGQRSDGYHELETFFQLVDLYDELNFFPAPLNTLELTCDSLTMASEQNLVYRATQRLADYARKKQLVGKKNSLNVPNNNPQNFNCLAGVKIELIKHTPTGAGMGGGSSNAAATLLALNHLWQLELSIEELASIGQGLGADIPVFVQGKSAWARGTGDQLVPSPQPNLWFVLVKPAVSCSTQDIFQHPALTRTTKPIISTLLQTTQSIPDFSVNSSLWRQTHNDCQAIATELYPEIHALVQALSDLSPAARMTGTGSVCFAPFATQAQAVEAKEKLENISNLPIVWSKVVQGINYSPPPALSHTTQLAQS